MHPVKSLAIAYDAECGLCTRVKDWMSRQATDVALEFLPAGSPEMKKRYPQLSSGELSVIANTGEVWVGNHAWIVCLWALREYRDLSFRLTSPLLALMAREAFALVSTNRLALSRLLRLRNEHEIQLQLREVMVPRCQSES